MKLRSLIGARAGEIRDYSPIAARGALASGVATRVFDELHAHESRALFDVLTAETLTGKPKVTHPSRRKG